VLLGLVLFGVAGAASAVADPTPVVCVTPVQVLKEEIKKFERKVRDHNDTVEALEDAKCVPSVARSTMLSPHFMPCTVLSLLFHLWCLLFGLRPPCRRLDSEFKMELARRLDAQLNENGALQDEMDVLKRELARLTAALAAPAGGSGAGADGASCSWLQLASYPYLLQRAFHDRSHCPPGSLLIFGWAAGLGLCFAGAAPAAPPAASLAGSVFAQARARVDDRPPGRPYQPLGALPQRATVAPPGAPSGSAVRGKIFGAVGSFFGGGGPPKKPE
jgi:hypothetical protein